MNRRCPHGTGKALGRSGVHCTQRQHRGPAHRCRPGRAASLRRDGSARGLLRPLCRPAVSAPCCSGPQIPGTAAGAQKAGAVLPGAPVAAPGRVLGRVGGVPAAFALDAAVRLVCCRLHPHRRTGCAGVCRPAGGGPAARLCRDRSKARRRGICPAAQR